MLPSVRAALVAGQSLLRASPTHGGIDATEVAVPSVLVADCDILEAIRARTQPIETTIQARPDNLITAAVGAVLKTILRKLTACENREHAPYWSLLAEVWIMIWTLGASPGLLPVGEGWARNCAITWQTGSIFIVLGRNLNIVDFLFADAMRHGTQFERDYFIHGIQPSHLARRTCRRLFC